MSTLMKKEFLKLAFDLVAAMKIPHGFNKEKQVAGKHFSMSSCNDIWTFQ